MDTLSKQTRILRALKAAGSGGVENWKLAQITFRFSARLGELRADGYIIPPPTRDKLKNGRTSNTFRYHLIEEHNKPTLREKLNKVLHGK
jgi:hypothetical protein